MVISWEPPEPRRGWRGALDRFTGPGATAAELWLQVGAALVSGAGLVAYAASEDLGWNAARYIVGACLAMDMAGGVVTNATSSGKRWYHRPGQGFAREFGFVAVHAVQVFLVAWLFASMDWEFFGVTYGCLLAAALLLLAVPLYLQRPVACVLLCAALLANAYVLDPPQAWEWFVPVLSLKLLVCHLLKEAPFRPEREATA